MSFKGVATVGTGLLLSAGTTLSGNSLALTAGNIASLTAGTDLSLAVASVVAGGAASLTAGHDLVCGQRPERPKLPARWRPTTSTSGSIKVGTGADLTAGSGLTLGSTQVQGNLALTGGTSVHISAHSPSPATPRLRRQRPVRGRRGQGDSGRSASVPRAPGDRCDGGKQAPRCRQPAARIRHRHTDELRRVPSDPNRQLRRPGRHPRQLSPMASVSWTARSSISWRPER